MQSYQKLLLENKLWAAEKVDKDPEYFNKLAAVQKPDFLWIGCSDSRAPANELTNTQPGEVFVHRNVANMVVHTDLNMLSVLQYAVEVLQVKHVLVVGHYGCGGVKASMTNKDLGLINKWLRNIKDVYTKYEDELEAIADENDRADRLVELNVLEQVRNLAKTTIIQKAWANNQMPYLHGWVLDLKTGLIKSILEIQPGETDFIEKVYRYDFEKLKQAEEKLAEVYQK